MLIQEEDRTYWVNLQVSTESENVYAEKLKEKKKKDPILMTEQETGERNTPRNSTREPKKRKRGLQGPTAQVSTLNQATSRHHFTFDRRRRLWTDREEKLNRLSQIDRGETDTREGSYQIGPGGSSPGTWRDGMRGRRRDGEIYSRLRDRQETRNPVELSRTIDRDGSMSPRKRTTAHVPGATCVNPPNLAISHGIGNLTRGPPYSRKNCPFVGQQSHAAFVEPGGSMNRKNRTSPCPTRCLVGTHVLPSTRFRLA